MKFTVKRSNWYRGHGNQSDGVQSDGVIGNESRLLRTDGKRCCIGFVGQQCGYADDDLKEIGTIQSVPSDDRWWPKWMVKYDPPLYDEKSDILQCYIANDTTRLTDEQREAKLKEIFAKNGDEIEFVD